MTRACVGLAGIMLAAGLLAAQDEGPAPKPRQDDKLQLVLLWPEKLDTAAYFQSHPCVSGGWRFKEQTDTHWIGKLTYPTGNVPPPYPQTDEAAFEVGPVKIARKKGLGIDMTKWTGTVVLLMPDAKERFGSRKSLEGSFELVAHEVPVAPGTESKSGFLFQKHRELLYKPAKE